MSGLLEIDRAELLSSFGKRPFAVRHNLTDHPLLSVEAVAELAEELPADSVEHNLGQVPEVLAGGEAPRLDQSPGQVAREIDTNGCWMVLKHIEQSPRYSNLLNQALDEVTPEVAPREGGVRRREGYIFLSAPNSTTPAHTDPEHNLLLQIRGPKEMNVGRFPDADTEQRELERRYGGGHRNMPEKPAEATKFELDPGDGVYMPVDAPHWVTTKDSVSVSLSITFFTAASEARAHVYVLNARLRKLGLSPAMPGEHPGVDRAKAAVWLGGRTVVRGARRLTGKSRTPA